MKTHYELYSLVQVGVHVIIAVKFSQVNQYSRSTAAIPGPTEAAVADPSARWAQPLLNRDAEISQTRPTTHDQMPIKPFRLLTEFSRASRTSSP